MAKKTIVRKFLNRRGQEGMAAVHVQLDVGRSYVWGVLEITDCSRHIVLSLDGDTGAERANTLYKLGVLRDSIDATEQALVSTWAMVDEYLESKS